MTPPGLAFVVGLRRGAGAARAAVAALLLRLGAHAQGAGEARRAVHAGGLARPRLDVALGLLLEEGSRRRSTATRGSAARAREGVEGDGARAVLAGRGPRRAVVTAIRAARRRRRRRSVRDLRDRFGVTIASGQGELKGKIFRIGHIGWFDMFDITTALAALELVLAEPGSRSSAASP